MCGVFNPACVGKNWCKAVFDDKVSLLVEPKDKVVGFSCYVCIVDLGQGRGVNYHTVATVKGGIVSNMAGGRLFVFSPNFNEL